MDSKGREVKRCTSCNLVQFINSLNACRRCKVSFIVKQKEEVKLEVKQERPVFIPSPNLDIATATWLLRNSHSMSQHTLAALLGKNRSYVARVEGGIILPSILNSTLIASALGITLSGFLLIAEELGKSPV